MTQNQKHAAQNVTYRHSVQCTTKPQIDDAQPVFQDILHAPLIVDS